MLCLVLDVSHGTSRQAETVELVCKPQAIAAHLSYACSKLPYSTHGNPCATLCQPRRPSSGRQIQSLPQHLLWGTNYESEFTLADFVAPMLQQCITPRQMTSSPRWSVTPCDSACILQHTLDFLPHPQLPRRNEKISRYLEERGHNAYIILLH